MNHIMLDLETLGTGPRAAIVAIGAVAFNPAGDGIECNEFPSYIYSTVELRSALEYGVADGDTIKWWMEQSDAARQATFSAPNTLPLRDVLYHFTDFMEYHKGACIWSKGSLDAIWLRSAYEAVGAPPPWHYRQPRCYRTLIGLLPENRVATAKVQPLQAGAAHSAIDDAITQAAHMQRVWKALGLAHG